MANTTESFEQSWQYFQAHEAELILKYRNKVIVIYIDKVLGVYSSMREAYFNAPKNHNIVPGSFIITELSKSANAPRRYVGTRIAFT